MPALRILLLALTRRLAIAGSETRNARAISAVVRPARVLSVRATRASSGSAGWQQVNIRRSLSSWMPLSSSASRPESSSLRCIIATSSNLAAPVALRLKRSRARLRDTVVSHAPGRRGTPSRGQVSSARSKAPWAHSSARSQSPVVRIRVATRRPHSSLKAPATAASTSSPITLPTTVGSPSSRPSPWDARTRPRRSRRDSRTRLCRSPPSIPPAICFRLLLPERPHLDAPEPRARGPGCHLDRLVEVLALDYVVAGDLLLGLGERAVGEQHLLLAHPHRGGVFGGAQACPAPMYPPTVPLLAPAPEPRVVIDAGRVRQAGTFVADHQHVAHRPS